MFYRILASVLSIFPASLDYHSYFLVTPIESRIKIAIIDTGIENRDDIKPYLCKDEHFDFTGSGIIDTMRHGTNLAYLMAKTIDPNKNCIMVIKIFNGYGLGTKDGIPGRAIERAIQSKARFINLSWGGKDNIQTEKEAIQKAIDNKIYVFVAAGNDGRELKRDFHYYPACYDILSPYFRIVGNGKDPEHKQYWSNYGTIVTDWADGVNQCGGGYCMSGTSQATALITSKIAAKLSK